MRIKVRHQTVYTYERPAISTLQLLRMTPRSFAGQFVRRWRVEVDADAQLVKEEDAYGNISHLVTIDGPVERVTIAIEGEVDTVDTHGLIGGSVERQPERLFLRETRLTAPTPAIQSFARDIASGEGGDRLASLHRINAELHRLMRFDTSATTTHTTAAEAFESRAGVCQDFAHVFIAAARILGTPTRYVSGYYLRTDLDEQEAGHAWAEAHVDGLGWVGFDPAHGMCVTDRYVRVAIGTDYLEAAPVRGSQIGGSGEALGVTVHVTEGRGIVDGQ